MRRIKILFGFVSAVTVVVILTYSQILHRKLIPTGMRSVIWESLHPEPLGDSFDTENVYQFINNQKKNDDISRYLFRKVRIFCWIMTAPKNMDRAEKVKNTWANSCNKFLFVSSKRNDSLPSINANVSHEGRNTLWGKTKAAFRYLYENELENFDFFMKADDDTYVVTDNLRYLLLNESRNDPILFGRRFKKFVKYGYMSGGAGYIISRAGLRLMVEKGFGKIRQCFQGEQGIEDLNFGRCAWGSGVKPRDSIDFLTKERFHPLPLRIHLSSGVRKTWLWDYNHWPLKWGLDCCSNYTISFHYVTVRAMTTTKFCVAHWHPFGIIRNFKTLRNLSATILRKSKRRSITQRQHKMMKMIQVMRKEIKYKKKVLTTMQQRSKMEKES